MSIFGMMRTATSGMAAQSNRLGTVSDNVANVSTHGYKRAFAEFSTIVLESGSGSYVPGSVDTQIRYAITEQGGFDYTTSKTDIAISGNGFFIVGDGSGATYLTRAGSFIKMESGDLVNAAGFQLLGYPITNGNPTLSANGTTGLEPVNIASMTLQASPSREGTFYANLPVNADIVTDLPSGNAATAQYTAKSSLTVIDRVGTAINLDVYFAKTAADNWEMVIYPSSAADPVTEGFPYSPGTPLLNEALEFDPNTARLILPDPAEVQFPMVDGGTDLVTLDISSMTQLDDTYQVRAIVDGNPPSAVDHVEFGPDGTLYSVFENGARLATYRIPLATVPAPDNLTPQAGNVYVLSATSGDLQLGFPGEGQYGVLKTSTLEKSTVDAANELTTMIEAQYSYTANSKVFQTAGELMEVLVNLKR